MWRWFNLGVGVESCRVGGLVCVLQNRASRQLKYLILESRPFEKYFSLNSISHFETTLFLVENHSLRDDDYHDH